MARSAAAWALLATCALSGCRAQPPELLPRALFSGDAPVETLELLVGGFRVVWEGEGAEGAALRVTRSDAPHAVLLETEPGRAFVAAGSGAPRFDEERGSFEIDEGLETACADQVVDAVRARRAGGVEITGRLVCPSREVPYVLTLEAEGTQGLRLELVVEGEGLDRVALGFASDADERVFGFGEQFTRFDVKGERVPIFAMEQGIGRGRQPLTWLVDLVARSGGDWSSSYAPVPHFLTTRDRSFFLENTEYSVFDLRDARRIDVQVFAPRMRAHLVHARDPLARVEAFTAYAGRMRRLPAWAHAGAIVGIQGGTARVREAVAALEAEGTPLAAVWIQDWVGRRTTSFGEQLWWSWQLDRARYPEWEALVEELAARGIRVLTYVNPFLVKTDARGGGFRDLYAEAEARGYLVMHRDGEPYRITITDFEACLVDLSNPEARAWLAGVIRDDVLGVGASGWMADFGEALPADALLASGESAAAWHNRYPVEWARLNREVIDASGRGDDIVFFTRAGGTRSPAYSTLFWLGDQLVSWDEYDGIKSSVTGLLSGGLSGFSLNHSDIGGYTAIDRPLVGVTRSRELLWRWIELAAFQPVFRSHEGNLPDANHQFDSDPETLRHFARFAKVFAAWGFFRERLLEEAATRGWPVVRHPFLHHPGERAYWSVRSQQFQLGDVFVVAPVLASDRAEAKVRLPAGRWVHAFSGRVYSSAGPDAALRVPAPLGEPAVFYPEGSAVGETFRRNLQAAGVLRAD